MNEIERLTLIYRHASMQEDPAETTYYFALTHRLPPEDMLSEDKYEGFVESELGLLDGFIKSLPKGYRVVRIDRYESIDAKSIDFDHPGETVTLRIKVKCAKPTTER